MIHKDQRNKHYCKINNVRRQKPTCKCMARQAKPSPCSNTQTITGQEVYWMQWLQINSWSYILAANKTALTGHYWEKKLIPKSWMLQLRTVCSRQRAQFFSNTSQPWQVNDFFFCLKNQLNYSWGCKDCMFSMHKRTANGQMVINRAKLNITNFVRLPNKQFFLSHYSINCEQARQEKSSHQLTWNKEE